MSNQELIDTILVACRCNLTQEHFKQYRDDIVILYLTDEGVDSYTIVELMDTTTARINETLKYWKEYQLLTFMTNSYKLVKNGKRISEQCYLWRNRYRLIQNYVNIQRNKAQIA